MKNVTHVVTYWIGMMRAHVYGEISSPVLFPTLALCKANVLYYYYLYCTADMICSIKIPWVKLKWILKQTSFCLSIHSSKLQILFSVSLNEKAECFWLPKSYRKPKKLFFNLLLDFIEPLCISIFWQLKSIFCTVLADTHQEVLRIHLCIKAAGEINYCVLVRVCPLGKIVGKSDGLTELLHIPNSAKVVNIKDPQPGMWSIKVNNSFFTWECV